MTKCTHKQLMTACMLAGTLMLGACTSTPPVTKEVSIVPITNHLEETNGAFVLKSNTSIGVIDAELIPAAEYLADMLSSATGYDLKVKEGEGTITLALGDIQGKEGAYTLTAESDKVNITGNSYGGVIAGIESLRQLFPPQIESKEIVKGTDWAIPAVNIQDAPRFEWRGIMLDVSRHFYTIDEVKELLDVMALYKMNKFHWHLTDDQGWRIEIKKYPKLTTVGGYRKKTIVGYMWDNPTEWDTKRYGGFYTQEDIKEVVAYAKKRFVEIIPEIEMPGHSVAALTAYPEYSCTGGPFEVEGRWGVFNDIYCTKESTFTFMQDILDEVVELFPSSYIHLGGDEASRIRWKNCVHCQERMKQEHLTKEAELQTYFINRIENYLNTKGKKIIGWDEILEGGILQRATVMSWRGEKGGIHAAKAGYDVIMSPNIYMYFNCLQSKVNEKKIGNPNRVITLEKVYNYHPVPEVLSADEAKHIKGVQANLWTEYMSALDEMEYMLYPRVAALSEVAWSKKENKDYGRFCTRLESIRRHYDVLGVNYCKKISNE